jgi:acyl-coenzyme A synthetase/AMP-(fatty) acid ligase
MAGSEVASVISVRGPSLGRRPDGLRLDGDDGWFRTTDLGVVVAGNLSVVGRIDDIIIVHGRQIMASSVEAAVTSSSLSGTHVAAIQTVHGQFALVLEVRDGFSTDLRAKLAAAKRAVATTIGVSPEVVIAVRRGQIPRSRSGKIQRRRLTHALSVGDVLPIEVVE